MKVLVTGGAGFIGHHLVRALLDRGHVVAVLDDLSTGYLTRLEPLLPSIRFVQGSVLDDAALREAMADAEVVFHLAAIPSVARSLVDPLLSNEVNVTGTIRTMLSAGALGVRRVVLAGSSSVYGLPDRLPCDESMRPMPESPYGASKLAAEHYLRTIGLHAGVETVSLRYFNVFGPGQDPASEYAAVVPRFVTTVLAGGRPTVNGIGDVSRDFTFVDNVVSANLLAAEASAPSGIVCNVACGQRTTLLELLHLIAEAAGRAVDPIFGPPRPGDIKHSLADISAARDLLGYSVLVALEEGIRRTVAWYRTTTPVTG